MPPQSLWSAFGEVEPDLAPVADAVALTDPPLALPAPRPTPVTSVTAAEQLFALLRRRGRPPLAAGATQPTDAQLRKRTGVYASKVAALMTTLVHEVSVAQGLLLPLTVGEVVRATDFWTERQEGTKDEDIAKNQLYARAVIAIGQSANTAVARAVAGHMAAKWDGDQVPARVVARDLGRSVSTVAQGRQDVQAGRALGVLTSLARAPQPRTARKKMYPDAELAAWRVWLGRECPARSGDAFQVFWMTRTKEEFYYEVVRSVAAQKAVIAIALSADRAGVVAASAEKRNVWGRNAALYLHHEQASLLLACLHLVTFARSFPPPLTHTPLHIIRTLTGWYSGHSRCGHVAQAAPGLRIGWCDHVCCCSVRG